jgi:hypothetical protein
MERKVRQSVKYRLGLTAQATADAGAGHLDYRQNGVTTNRTHSGKKIRAVNLIFRKVRMRMNWMILQ